MTLERLTMFEFHFFLTAGLTMIGFVSAMPPRLLLIHLKNLRSRVRRPAPSAAAEDCGSGSEGRRP